MILSFMVAASENNVIAHNGEIPWHLPNDLKWLQNKSSGCTIIMGRKTYEPIGKPLPLRRNIVISRTMQETTGCHVARDIAEATFIAGRIADSDDEEVFVFGGEQIFREMLGMARRIYLTRVHATLEGDTFFPELPAAEWKRVWAEPNKADRWHEYDYTFEIWERTYPWL